MLVNYLGLFVCFVCIFVINKHTGRPEQTLAAAALKATDE